MVCKVEKSSGEGASGFGLYQYGYWHPVGISDVAVLYGVQKLWMGHFPVYDSNKSDSFPNQYMGTEKFHKNGQAPARGQYDCRQISGRQR